MGSHVGVTIVTSVAKVYDVTTYIATCMVIVTPVVKDNCTRCHKLITAVAMFKMMS